MLLSLIDAFGNWNPQLLRELKGHFKPLKIGVAIALAIIGQIVFSIAMQGTLPGPVVPSSLQLTTYPAIGVDYEAYDGTTPPIINHLTYQYPLEPHPGYDAVIPDPSPSASLLNVGDRLLAIGTVSLQANAAAEGQPHQQLVEDTLKQPYADRLNQLFSETSGPQAASALRQEIPGTTVQLTVEHSGRPMTVDVPRMVTSSHNNSYCQKATYWGSPAHGDRSETPQDTYQSLCHVAVGGTAYTVAWQRWHQQAFYLLSVVLTFAVLVLGTYAIINNLQKEERDGTLNFIRLSPQSAWNILFGKLLGVPALMGLAVALTVPLHLWHGLAAGAPWLTLGAFYSASGAIAFLLFSAALLIGMINVGLGVVQAWLGAGAVFFLQLCCLQISYHLNYSADNNMLSWSLLLTPFSVLRRANSAPLIMDEYIASGEPFRWFGIPLGSVLLLGLLLLHTALLSRWIWGVLERRFFSPSGTLLSKAQSYGLTLIVNATAMGFSWRMAPQSFSGSKNTILAWTSPWIQSHLTLLILVNLTLWFFFMATLSPQRQSLHDWARYRHLLPTPNRPSQSQTTTRRRQALWHDLVWGEKSPVGVAIAINLLLGMACMVVWALSQTLIDGSVTITWLMMGLILGAIANLLLLITTVVQFIFLARKQQATPTALLTALALLGGIPVGLALLAGSLNTSFQPQLWLMFSPWVYIYAPPISMGLGLLGLGLQAILLLSLNSLLVQRLRKIGQSESGLLLAPSR